MNKPPALPKEDQEKKQLQEIAHLYFSTPSPASKEPDPPKRAFGSFSPFPRTLFVRCVAGQNEQGLATWLLFNLSVMLKIVDGPVLLVGSEGVYGKRYLFGFRPDRERLQVPEGPRFPSGNLGPMGVCLLDSRILWKGFGEEGRMYSADPMAGRQVAFRYILSDEARAGGVFRSLPGLAVFLVSAATTTPALLDRALGEEDEDLLAGEGHAGILVAGAGSPEEARALFLYWRNKLAERCAVDLHVEDFGALPSEAFGPSQDSLPWRERGIVGVSRGSCYGPLGELEPSGVGVLESPDSALASFCRRVASSIRSKRSELLHSA